MTWRWGRALGAIVLDKAYFQQSAKNPKSERERANSWENGKDLEPGPSFVKSLYAHIPGNYFQHEFKVRFDCE
ncbi:hypothetical protein DdX_17750 [Ditylenchus destructor]|uniref:Uncharacterized protein n=1 Tax=Ditylenchus destructor TaxID=166010 RepID=A0AAD4MMV5_9BILA|nr:hypothetical protein DdX_17750 [Ditylenchus destructor]